MKVVTLKTVEKTDLVSALFTGSGVGKQELTPESQEISANVIHFPAGIRNKLHAHDHEQILVVTGGEGIVATKYDEYAVSEGDVIWIPANEKHWHGAKPDSEFSHISFTLKGSTISQFED